MFKHILVPTDGSELSQQTARHAIAFAKSIGARITFFSARPPYHADYSGEGTLVDFRSPEEFDAATETKAKSILDEICKLATEAGVQSKAVSDVSDVPYRAIIDAAESYACDMIFMASHGRSGLSSIIMGSQTNKVLTNSTIPVLVYR